MLDRKTVDYLLEYTCNIFGVSENELTATTNDLKKVGFTFENEDIKVVIQHKTKMIPSIVYNNYLSDEKKVNISWIEFCDLWRELEEDLPLDEKIDAILKLDKERKIYFPEV